MTLSNDTEAASKPSQEAVEVVQHTPRPVAEVWTRLTQREGIEAFLGEGAMLGDKGDPWHASDGTYGVTRSYHPEEQVRVSWHADEDAPPTLVDLRMAPEGEGTLLTLRHEHLPSDADREALLARWDAALQRLTQM
ncbi:SRPBCC family protein [Gephyromycinifex aptenodytis]|uniref:SRPBCC family protein n=1 Tax=Gephyromycinifex aptenodytis TaxID=2716227 RepID=UPI001444B451|nr:SRPBCC domain-containing protein [Gephyromycinifex aptenodytis]